MNDNPRSKGRKIAVCIGGTLWWQFPSFASMVKVTGIPYQTLYYWHKNSSNRIIKIYHLDDVKDQDKINWQGINLLLDMLNERF